jgi:hypothetical protein
VKIIGFEIFKAVVMVNAVFRDVGLVKTDVSDERVASIFRVKNIR